MADTTTPPPPFSPQASRPLTPIGEKEPVVTVDCVDEASSQADEAASSAGSNDESEDAAFSSAGYAGDGSCIVVEVPAPTASDEVNVISEDSTVSDGPIASEDPTVSDVPTASDAPIASEDPTVNKDPTVNDVPTASEDATFTGDTSKTASNGIAKDVCFHVDADLLIKVHNDHDEDVYYRVSSANFACASTVWRLDLYGGGVNLRSSDDDPLPVDIGTAGHAAFATLMNIVHYRFGDVPDDIELSQLYHITQLTKKFNCTHLIRPWAISWIQNEGVRAALFHDAIGDGRLSEMGAKIAWELGDSSLLKSMGEVMIMTVIVEDGDLIHGCHKKLRELNLPPGMFETISRTRFNVVSKLLAAIRRPYDKLASRHRFCPLNEHQECDATMLGSLTMQLATHGLFPVRTVDNYKGTLRELKSAISGIKLKRWQGKDIAPHLSHVGCNLGITDDAKAAMESMRFSLEEAEIQHLETQRRLSGIPVEE